MENVNKERIQWLLVDSIDFYSADMHKPIRMSADHFAHQLDSDSIVDLTRIDSKRVKLNINTSKLKKHIDAVVKNLFDACLINS